MSSLELAKYLPAFLQTAKTLSFSQAARNLEVTPAAVSKSVKVLETKLGIRLFHRTTHALTLTEDGESFYRSAGPAACQLNQLFENTQNLKTTPRGKLKVSVPDGFGKRFILPLMKSFLARYPNIELDLHLDDRRVDLVQEGYDIAIGNRVTDDANIVSRNLTPLNLICVASPTFVERYGLPNSVKDLGNRPCIRYRPASTQKLMPWRYKNAQGEIESFEPENSVINVNNIEALCELASYDVGATIVATWHADSYMADGRLVEILPECAIELQPIRIYYASRENQPAKVRAFIDFLIENFDH